MKKSNMFYIIITTLISLSLFVICAEIILRTKGTLSTWSERNQGKYVSPYEEPPYSSWYWLRTPNDTTSYNQPEFNYELITNSLGIRDNEHLINKEDKEFRIIGLGDSFTEGVGVPYENSYLKILERNLNKKLNNNICLKIISGGVSGSDPFYSYTLLKDKLLKYKPDIVTLAINGSDITDIIARGGKERFLENGKVRFAKPPRFEWLFAKSHLYRFVIMRFFKYDWFGLSPSDHIVKREEAVEKIIEALIEFKELSIREDFILLVIIHPCNIFEVLSQRYSFNSEKLKTI